MKKNVKSGFSLVELLVAMAIIAVLISIAAFGIQIVQRNSRDTKRRKVVQDLQLLAADVQTSTFKYPSALAKDGTNLKFTDGTNTLGSLYPVKGFTIITDVADCSNAAFAAVEGNAGTLSVCFNATALTVGVKLEAGAVPYITNI